MEVMHTHAHTRTHSLCKGKQKEQCPIEEEEKQPLQDSTGWRTHSGLWWPVQPHLTSCVNISSRRGGATATRDCNQGPDTWVLLFKVCNSTKLCSFMLSKGWYCYCALVVYLFRFDWLQVCFSVDLLSYITRFQWDKAKYPTTNRLSSLKELINKV